MKQLFIVREGEEELTLGRKGCWHISTSRTGHDYVQFMAYDESFVGVMICVKTIETRASDFPTRRMQIKVVTETGTVLQGDACIKNIKVKK